MYMQVNHMAYLGIPSGMPRYMYTLLNSHWQDVSPEPKWVQAEIKDVCTMMKKLEHSITVCSESIYFIFRIIKHSKRNDYQKANGA